MVTKMTVKLMDICSKIGSGATPRGGKEAYREDGISLVRSQNVLDFEFTDSGLAHINDEQARKLNNVEVMDGDILINITGDSVARACMMDAAFLPARVNQHVAIIRGEKDKVISSYILYFLQMMKRHLLQLASSGATRNALTKGMLEQLELELPDIETQKRITSLLDSIQEKIALNRKINDNLAA
jgi:type I restriction enzyme S subunit